jgi:hypothetical protein
MAGAQVRHVPAILDLSGRGDWQTRTLSLSALGVIVRDDPYARRLHPFRHWVARRLPWLRWRFASVGPQGAFVREAIANALLDRTWMVRVAAALSLGECAAASAAPRLRPLLRDTFRPVRLAAAAALLACGDTLDAEEAVLAGADAATERIGDTERTLDWLARLAGAHRHVLARVRAWSRAAPGQDEPSAWAAYLAGAVTAERVDNREAEILVTRSRRRRTTTSRSRSRVSTARRTCACSTRSWSWPRTCARRRTGSCSTWAGAPAG